MIYQIGCVANCPLVEFCASFGATNHLEETFRERLAIPEDTMIASKGLDHAIPYISSTKIK
jgi:hypothetical protein